jgi:hypothetical protein
MKRLRKILGNISYFPDNLHDRCTVLYLWPVVVVVEVVVLYLVVVVVVVPLVVVVVVDGLHEVVPISLLGNSPLDIQHLDNGPLAI